MKFYIDGSPIQVGDVFTDGGTGRESDRLQNKGKILYVDKYNIVWFPLSSPPNVPLVDRSLSWFIKYPKKVNIEDLTKEEFHRYSNSDKFLK